MTAQQYAAVKLGRYLFTPWRAGVWRRGAGDVQGAGATAGGGGPSDPNRGEDTAVFSKAPVTFAKARLASPHLLAAQHINRSSFIGNQQTGTHTSPLDLHHLLCNHASDLSGSRSGAAGDARHRLQRPPSSAYRTRKQ